ncbi:hypothetical protein N9937_01490 [bacterium]|nr:hypothetical protein [bacterium]
MNHVTYTPAEITQGNITDPRAVHKLKHTCKICGARGDSVDNFTVCSSARQGYTLTISLTRPDGTTREHKRQFPADSLQALIMMDTLVDQC